MKSELAYIQSGDYWIPDLELEKHSFPYFVILACSYCMLLIQCGEVQTYQLSGF